MGAERIPIIQVKDLYKIYKVGTNKVYALNGVDFTMYKGEFCAIVGPSGSGKSTLLNMLASGHGICHMLRLLFQANQLQILHSLFIPHMLWNPPK